MVRTLLGRGLGLAACVWLAGCASGGSALLDLDSSLAADLGDSSLPRLARMQASEPRPPSGGPAQASYRPTQPAPDAKTDFSKINVRARVNGHPIFDEDVSNALMPFLAQLRNMSGPDRDAGQAKAFKIVIDQIIEDEIIYQEAVTKLEKMNPKALVKLREAADKDHEKKLRDLKAANKWSDSQYEQVMRQEKSYMDFMRRSDERKFIGMEYVRSRIFPWLQRIGHEQVEEYYRQHLNEFQKVDAVKWQDLFVAVGPKHQTQEDAVRFARELIARLKTGESFAKLVDEFDDGDSKVRHGDGYGSRRGEIRPTEVEDTLFRMRDGEVGPLVEMSTGVHVIRMVKRDYAGPIPLNEETQKAIRNKLRNEMANQEYKRLLRDLRDRTVVEIERN